MKKKTKPAVKPDASVRTEGRRFSKREVIVQEVDGQRFEFVKIDFREGWSAGTIKEHCRHARNGFGTAFVNRLLKKRLLSSPAAFASTLEKHVASLSAARPTKPDAMAERILYKAILKADEDYADDREVENAQAEAIEEATRRSMPLTAEQRAILDDLRAWAQRARNQTDSKAQAILGWLTANLKTNGEWKPPPSRSRLQARRKK